MTTGDVANEDVKTQIKNMVVELAKHVGARDAAIANSKHIQDEIASRKKRYGPGSEL
jgi:hypothetical protein